MNKQEVFELVNSWAKNYPELVLLLNSLGKVKNNKSFLERYFVLRQSSTSHDWFYGYNPIQAEAFSWDDKNYIVCLCLNDIKDSWEWRIHCANKYFYPQTQEKSYYTADEVNQIINACKKFEPMLNFI